MTIRTLAALATGAAGALYLATGTAFATQCPFGQTCTSVPEIDALSGVAALAVVGAAVALVRERSK